MREIADIRMPGTTGAASLVRFACAEAAALKPLGGRPPFRQVRKLTRWVQPDGPIQIDGNSYGVPRRLIGESVRITVAEGRVRIHHAGAEVAVPAETAGRHQRIVDPRHFHGVAGRALPTSALLPATAPQPALLRKLAEYEPLPAEAGREHQPDRSQRAADPPE
jgi:hypothetical protein